MGKYIPSQGKKASGLTATDAKEKDISLFQRE